LRGAGDVLGTKQTGLPEFHFADIMRNAELMRMARDEAQTLWQSDPTLQSERGRAVQLLLRLFGYDDTVHALKVA
jgi:ATP-dependent DNA helicase RecG